MKAFGKNVFRLAGQNKGSFIGAVLIISIGIFCYVAMMDTLGNLKGQVEQYYEESTMADVFAEVSGISSEELKRLEEIPGIRLAAGRMAADVRMLAEGQEEIVTVHLLSYDEDDVVNRLALSSGFKSRDNIFLGARMEGVYGYEDGMPLKLLWNGKSTSFSMKGTCNGPDYIYAIPPGGAMIPDGTVYDIACIQKDRMEELTGKYDIVNELGFLLEADYTYEDIRSVLSERLAPYGLISMSKKEDQTSYDMVEGEIGELISMGTILPFMFLSISVFMLYVVLKKMIDRDQSLIGTMKAFGMTDLELLVPYLMEGLIIGVAGALVGAVLAAPFGRYMFGMYVEFFNLPNTIYHDFIWTRITGILLAAATGAAAAYLGVRDILRIVPAQAMRQAAPKNVGNVRIPGQIARQLNTVGKMALRSVTRNPFRGFLLVLAVCFPFSMASVLMSFQGVADQMYMDQFEKIQVYDLQLSLDSYVSPKKAEEAGELLESVEKSEAVCTMAVQLGHENRSEYAMLYGLNRGSDLWKIRDMYGTYYEPLDGGIILNTRMAEKLQVQKGDAITMYVAGVTAEKVKVPVTDVISESVGSGCYMELGAIRRFLPMEAAANTVVLKLYPGMLEWTKQKLLDTSRVTWMVDTQKIVGTYRSMMGSMILMVNMFAVMAAAAGGVLIYNISMINIRERVNEFGTLLVLGMSEKKISGFLAVEQGFYFILGILAGIPGSRGIKTLVEKVVISDSYSIDMHVSIWAYMGAFFICLAITALAGRGEMRFVRNIRLTEVLKERE